MHMLPGTHRGLKVLTARDCTIELFSRPLCSGMSLVKMRPVMPT